MSKNGKLLCILICYPVICLLPYFLGGLNDPAVKLFGFPLTVAYPVIAMLVFCGVLYWASQNTWRTPHDKD